jgi:hypothetical protein
VETVPLKVDSRSYLSPIEEIDRCIERISNKVKLDYPHVEIECPNANCRELFIMPFGGYQPFTECMRLECNKCKIYFCAWCGRAAGRTSADAHDHVKVCPENTKFRGSISGDRQGDFTEFVAHHDNKRALKALDEWNKLSEIAKRNFRHTATLKGVDPKLIKLIK